MIKSIDLSKLTPEQKKDAHLEGKILKELSHPNIIHFREVLTDKDYLYIVMDYADGGDLSMKIREQNGKFFPENKILDWFTQVCLAIKHIHDRKILHRDIKSQNIFLMKNGQIKLGDFGIAKCLNQTIDKAKTYVGTPYYLSPEIINSQPYDFKSDIWSLGVLLYEMCALKMPFDASNLPQLYIKIINCNYQPLSNNYSDELKKLVKAMLNETSLKRPNIGEVLNYSIIKSRIKKFLTQDEYEAEFSHTVLHKFNLSSSDEKPNKKKKDVYDKNLRVSSGYNNNIEKKINYHYYNQQQIKEQEKGSIDLLKKNLEGKANQLNINKNKNKPNYVNYLSNNNNSNNSGYYKNKKGKVINKEEYISDKNNKNMNININNSEFNVININNGQKYEPNSGSKQRKIDYIKKANSNKLKIINTPSGNISNINNNINNISNIKSNREKEKERKKKLDEIKRKGKQNKFQNGDTPVVWMKGMENYIEKKQMNFPNEIIDNYNIGINNINNNVNNITTKITENDQRLCNDLILGKNSEKKEINGKNLMLLNNKNLNDINKINIINMNNSNEFLNEEEIKDNSDLYEDMMKQEINNNIEDNTNTNDNTYYTKLKENINNEYELNINEELVNDNIFNDISKEFGNELSQNISNIIKKYVNDDILIYDYAKITENIIKECKKNNIAQNVIEKAINQIPDFYYLILCKRL